MRSFEISIDLICHHINFRSPCLISKLTLIYNYFGRDAAIIQAEQEEEEAVEIMRTEHNEKENREPIQVDDVEQVIRRSAVEHLNLNIHNLVFEFIKFLNFEIQILGNLVQIVLVYFS